MAKEKIRIDNPFVTTGYAGADYFCDREKETADIIRFLTNGNNVALISPRRYGKSDLLRQCFAQKSIADNYYTFIVDIYSTKSVAEMVGKLGSAILEALKPRGKKAWEKFLAILSSVRSGISFDINGQPSWTMSIGDIHSPAATLDEIFAYLQNADRPCLVVIDEFQQITKYGDPNIEAEIRTRVQYCTNAHFVFSGSRRQLMGAIFTSPARPFYQSVSMMFLKPVALLEYESFAKGHFEKAGKQIADDVVKAIYDRFDGTTWYLQKVLNQLFATRDSVVVSDVDKAVEQIINQNEEAYQDILYQLTARQRDLLVAVSREGKARQITGSAFVKRHHLSSASSVQKSAQALTEKQLLTHQQGIYEVYDKFMSEWLQKS